MPRKKYDTLILMPYLPLDGYFKFDNLIVWSYKKKKDDFIKDIDLKNHLDKLVACYQFFKGGVIQNPSIISVSKVNFSNPKPISISKIEVLKNILLLAGVLENNAWSFITSDNLEVFYQRFNVGEEGIATRAGAIHTISAGGYKIGEVAFIKPSHINIPLHFRPKRSVIFALENCMKNSSSNPAKSQIIQSLNLFFNAYRNSHEHSWQSRVLLLIIAFELLFGQSGRPHFRKNIQKYSNFDSKVNNPAIYNYPIVNWGKITSREQLTLNQIWAEEFYKLRHKIIHGNTVYSDDLIFHDLNSLVKPREPHFYIAVNFYVVCLLNKLREIGFMNVPHFIINPDSKSSLGMKNISGIKDELFKIENIEIFDLLKTQFKNDYKQK